MPGGSGSGWWFGIDTHLLPTSIGREYASSYEAGDAGTPDAGAHGPIGQAASAKWHLFRRLDNLAANTRIRSTFSYHSCPAGSSETPATLSLAANFDWVLVGKRVGATQSEWLAVSEGLDETNEGFDIRLPAAFDWVEFRVVAPGGLTWPCDQTGSPSAASNEPYHWAAAISP